MSEHGLASPWIEKRTCPQCQQENEPGRDFCWACQGKLPEEGGSPPAVAESPEFEGGSPEMGSPEMGSPEMGEDPYAGGLRLERDSSPLSDQPQDSPFPESPQPDQDIPPAYGPREESPSREDAQVDWGPSVKLAYTPSGKLRSTSTLLFSGLTGLFVGLLKASLVMGGALVVNVIHNLLPHYFFVLPVIIFGLMLLAPFAVGMGVGEHVAKGAVAAKCRMPLQAGMIAFLWTIGGLALFVFLGQSVMPPGESFLIDRIGWFVRMMIGGSLSSGWMEEPEPIGTTYETIIFVMLGLSVLAGAFVASHTASNSVRSVPFCESCNKPMDPVSLWSISPSHSHRAIQAFRSMHLKEINEIPCCRMFDNYVSVDLWSCTCDSKSILELVGHGVELPEEDGDEPTVQDPVRIFSRPLTPEQTSQIRA